MKAITATISICLFAGLAACNTVEGAGQDVAAGGQAVSETAREAEREITD